MKTAFPVLRADALFLRTDQPSPFVRRLNRAFLMAFLAPAAACSSGSGDAVTAPDSGGVDARGADSGPSDASPAQDATAGDGNSSAADGSSGSDGPSDAGLVEACALDAGLPSGSMCTQYAYPPCAYDGGALSSAECTALCPPSDAGFSVIDCSPSAAGSQILQCSYSCAVGGRRSDGLVDPPTKAVSVATFFAQCAWLEAVSVHAFRRLARELRSLGAREELVQAAERAAGDEERHARTMSRIARERGGQPVRARALPTTSRDALEIARENAVEGCVREAYGALVAKWQSERVTDPALRRALGRIARDEARHAEIAWQVAAWLEPRLAPAERAEIARARAAAVEDLRTATAQDPPGDLCDKAGLPSAPEARRLLHALEQIVVTPTTARLQRSAGQPRRPPGSTSTRRRPSRARPAAPSCAASSAPRMRG